MVIKIAGYYHLLQAFLMTLTLTFYGYSIRTDFAGWSNASSPIFYQVLIGVSLLWLNSIIPKRRKFKQPQYATLFVTTWFVSNVIKISGFDFYIANIVWIYLMPSLYFVFSLKRKLLRWGVILSCVLGFIVFTLLGARGYALFPLALLFLKPIIDYLKGVNFVKKFLIFSLFILVGFSYMTLVDIYRFTQGRDEVNISGFLSIASGASDLVRDDVDVLIGTAFWDRFLNHPMNLMLNEPFDLRSGDFFLKDVVLVFDRSESNFTNTKYGHWTSAEHGFQANELTSVEWSILSDWSSRYGNNIGILLTIVSYILIALFINLVATDKLTEFIVAFQFLSSFFVFNFFENLHFLLISTILSYALLLISHAIQISSYRNI